MALFSSSIFDEAQQYALGQTALQEDLMSDLELFNLIAAQQAAQAQAQSLITQYEEPRVIENLPTGWEPPVIPPTPRAPPSWYTDQYGAANVNGQDTGSFLPSLSNVRQALQAPYNAVIGGVADVLGVPARGDLSGANVFDAAADAYTADYPYAAPGTYFSGGGGLSSTPEESPSACSRHRNTRRWKYLWKAATSWFSIRTESSTPETTPAKTSA